MPGLHFNVPWHRGSGCDGLGAAAPVTGAAADEHNLNVVDCDASVTVPRHSSPEVDPQPKALANVKDNGFPWPPPGLLGILRKTQFLRYYSVREPN